MSDWLSASFGDYVQTQSLPSEVRPQTYDIPGGVSKEQWLGIYQNVASTVGAVQGVPVQQQQYVPAAQVINRVPVVGGDWGGQGGAVSTAETVGTLFSRGATPVTTPVVPGSSGTVPTGTIFVAATPAYTIKKGEQAGNLNDPRTIIGADGKYYSVTRTGTDQYQITSIPANVAVVGNIGSSYQYSPVSGVVVTIHRPGINYTRTDIVYGNNLVVKTLNNSQSYSPEAINAEVAKVLAAGKAIDPVPASSYETSLPTTPPTADNLYTITARLQPVPEPMLYVQSVLSAPKKEPSDSEDGEGKAPSGEGSETSSEDESMGENFLGTPGGEGSGVSSEDESFWKRLKGAIGFGEDESEEDEEEEPTPPSKEEGSDESGDSSSEEGTVETFSVRYPGYIDVVDSSTGTVIRSYNPDTGQNADLSTPTFSGVSPVVDDSPSSGTNADVSGPVTDDIYAKGQSQLDAILLGRANAPVEIIVHKPPGFADDAPPTTNEEIDYVLSEALQRYNQGGAANGQNARISKYFPRMIPYIVTGEVNPNSIDSLITGYEEILNGSVSESHMSYIPGHGYVGTQITAPFSSMTNGEQRSAMRELFAKSLTEQVPIGYTLVMLDQLIASSDNEANRNDLRGYIKNGGFEQDLVRHELRGDKSGIINWLHSSSGLTSIGALAGLIGIAGAAASGGVSAIGGSVLTAVFSTTELSNAFSPAAWKTKGEQQLAGTYTPDHVMVYNRTSDSVRNDISEYGRRFRDWDTATRTAEYERLQGILNALGVDLRNETAFFVSAGTYFNKLQEYNSLSATLKNYAKLVDVITGDLTGLTVIPAQITLIPPTDGKIEWPGGTTVAENGHTLTKDGSGTIPVKVYDADGNVLRTDLINYYPGQVINRDYSLLEKYGYGSNDKSEDTAAKSTLYHIVAPADSVVKVGAEYYQVGANGGTIGYRVQGGDQIGVEVSKTGHITATKNLYVINDPEATYAPALRPFGSTAQPPEHGMIVLNTSPDTTVFINGKPWQRTATANKIDVSNPGYYHVKTVDKAGTTWEKDVWVGSGQSLSIADPAKKDEFKSGGGGSGGGGSGGGGGGSAAKSASGPAIDTALIVYGATCADARIWQDEVEVSPEIDKVYAISPGYHAIKIEREGKKPWIKTIYAIKGDTITISPAFEDLDAAIVEPELPEEVEEPTTKRVFLNSNPSGGKVMVNGGAIGQWTPCYLDLPRGLYHFTVVKSGYADYDITCWVGDVIAWGDQAVALAQIAGGA